MCQLRWLVALVPFILTAPLPAQIDGRMLRWPDVSATEIAFVYAGDVWLVPKTGGLARRLSTPAGEEMLPRFSPDGSQIAFTGNYDGNSDVYVIPTTGGVATRLTHHPDTDMILDWFPDGETLLYASGMEAGKERFQHFYRTSKNGGLPQKLPIAYGDLAAISPDGGQLAYLPFSGDFRTWKRYRGGTAPDIWLFDLATHAARNLTQDPANDTRPMWHGDSLYFLSDRDANKRHNLWVLALKTGALRQLTHFDTLDVRFPAIGPDDVVFECGGRLYRFELASEQLHEVPVDVLTDRATLRPRVEKVAELISGFDLSPAGKRAVFEARGEIFSVPAEHGVVRNLTRSSGVAERFPAWSPDGETVAYWSDRGGEYELTLRAADGSGEETVATELGPGFRYALHWSPDSRKLAFADQEMRIWLHDRDTGKTTQIDRGLWLFEGGLRNFHVGWSADSRWLAYNRGIENGLEAIFLYDTRAAALHQVTKGFYNALLPTFDPEGNYLYLLWGRAFEPIFSDFEFNMVWANSTQIAAVTLRKDVASPLAPRDDEDKDAKDEDKKADEKKADEKPKLKPVEIDLDGFESRLVVLPAEAGNYWNLRATAGKVIYQRFPRSGERPRGGDDNPSGSLVFFDLEKREEKTIVDGIDGFALAAEGKKILVQKKQEFAIVDVEPDQKLEKKLATAELEMTVDPVAEWRQIFDDAWRFERDYFYDPNLHGVDWQEMRRRYGALLEDAVTRWDVSFVLGELIGELSSSHTYRGGGDQENPEKRSVGLLGASFALENGAFRIKDIVDVPAWESEVRSPLRRPGVAVEEGDYLLAVDGVPLDTSKDPWASFQGLAGKTVALKVNDKPSLDGAREVLVEPLASEARLRNLAWIEEKRRCVEEATGGRVGYVYVPDTGIHGHNELVRQFLAQFHLDGMIIDERFNNGGFTTERMIELLGRKTAYYRGVRSGPDWPVPTQATDGPKVMLINSWSGSGGDLFPYAFKLAGLGPLIGTRTWGGVIGLSGSPPLIDGGNVTVPTFGTFGKEGEWIIEGHGVDPDIEVIDDPARLAKGEDPQLERAIEEVLRMLAENPPRRTPKPAYPVIPAR